MRRDAEIAAGAQAEVPAHRQGHLADEPGDQVGAGGDRGAVGVGQQDRARVGDVAARRRSRAAPPRPGPCSAVWNAPATGERAHPRAGGRVRRRAWRARRARRRRRSGRRRCGWPAVSPAASIAATTSSGSPPRTADMPVGASAQAAAISAPRRAANATASAGVSAPATAAAVSSPTLCPATTRSAPPSSPSWPAAMHAERDEQRLGDRGVLDLVGVGGGAEAGAGRGR